MKKTIILFLVFSFSFFTHLSAQIISTYAGNGVLGYSGDEGPATSAEFHGPEGVAFDTSGNLYVADAFSNRIRKITVSTGIITTVAGGGSGLGLGAGGPATNAILSTPTGVAVDDSGNIYIADELYYVICKVTVSTGILTVVAGRGGSLNKGYSGDGGLATAATLDNPCGLTLDDTGNIYIADYENNVIRKVTTSTGIITTVVGNGYGYWHGAGTYTGGYTGDGGAAIACELHGPTGVALDSYGNIYIADALNNVIRKVTASNGIIYTLAGNGIHGYTGNGGPASSAEMTVNGVSLDKQGNIYIADGNYDIREVDTITNIINTVVGNGIGGYSGDGGVATAAELAAVADLAFDNSGNMYIADNANNVIRKVTYNTDTVTGVNKLAISNKQLTVFPNPTSGQITFQLKKQVIGVIEIFDIMGQKVYTANIHSYNTEINLQSQSDGIYFYRVLSENGELVGEGKFVIEK